MIDELREPDFISGTPPIAPPDSDTTFKKRGNMRTYAYTPTLFELIYEVGFLGVVLAWLIGGNGDMLLMAILLRLIIFENVVTRVVNDRYKTNN